MHRTCASCCVQQAQPFRVLGRNAPAQPSGSAQRPSPGTASTSLLGSVPCTPGGTAASGTRPGFLLGCGPPRPASRHPVRNTHRQPQINHNRQSKIPGFRQSRMPIFRQSRVPGFRKNRMPSSGISSSSSKRPKSVPKASQKRPKTPISPRDKLSQNPEILHIALKSTATTTCSPVQKMSILQLLNISPHNS